MRGDDGLLQTRLEALMAADDIEMGPAPEEVKQGGGGGGLFAVPSAGRAAAKPAARVIVHVDMDCFFAAIATLGHPSFRGKPLAVAHSNSAQVRGSAVATPWLML